MGLALILGVFLMGLWRRSGDPPRDRGKNSVLCIANPRF